MRLNESGVDSALSPSAESKLSSTNASIRADTRVCVEGQHGLEWNVRWNGMEW